MSTPSFLIHASILFIYLFVFCLCFDCFYLFIYLLITASQKFALLLKNWLSLVIPKNFVFSVTITIFAWLAVTIGFAGEELFYKLVIFIKPKKSTNKATAAESFFREGFKWRSPIYKRCKRLQLSEAYAEFCQTSKMERFVKIAVQCNHFHKKFYLRCLTVFWNASDLTLIWVCVGGE